MSNEQILIKAIEKAVDGGFQLIVDNFTEPNFKAGYIVYFDEDGHGWDFSLFSHDFARALWGEKYVCARDGYEIDQDEAKETPWRVSCNYENGDYSFSIKKFEYYLQEMVIADDPIKYLGKNL